MPRPVLGNKRIETGITRKSPDGYQHDPGPTFSKSARQDGLCSCHGFATQIWMQGGFACAGSSAVEAVVAGLSGTGALAAELLNFLMFRRFLKQATVLRKELCCRAGTVQYAHPPCFRSATECDCSAHLSETCDCREVHETLLTPPFSRHTVRRALLSGL